MKVCRNMMNASQRVRPHRSYHHNRAEQLNTSCMPYSSSNVHHASPVHGLRVPSGLGRMVLRVILLLLVLSGDIESNPGPVGQPTLEDLSDVRGALFEARAKWYDIGIELKLSVGTLNTIREDFPQAADGLREMCINWLKRIDPSPSWAALAKALESPPVGEEHLAQQLRDKYCRGKEEMITHAHPIPGPSPPGAPPTPQVKAMMYTPVTADMVTKTFLFSRDTESPPPTTMTELYTTFTQTLLLKYLSSHPVHGREQRKTLTFGDLPDDIHKHFTKLCEVAYAGILNGHQLVFSADQVDFDPLCLMQETPQLYVREGSPSSFHFLHLTLQEYLAAVHISQLPSREQTELIEQHLRHGHFKMVFRFLAGLTKLENITPNIVDRLLHSHSFLWSLNSDDHNDDRLTLFHWLFESHSDSTTMKILNLVEMNTSVSNMWTPLDFYVTGYCVAHSQCSWRIGQKFLRYGCIDDEKLELFSKGCHSSSTTTDCGCISSVNFGRGNITSEGIEHFLNIPQHIRQGIRELVLLGNELDAHACDIIAKAVPDMPMLEELHLDRNPAIGGGGAVSLIRALYTSRVKTLNLEDTGISEEDCVCLVELLKSNPHLECLDVGRNNLSSESVEMITSGVAHNSSLRRLNMSRSHFSMAAVVNLASLLSEQSNFKLVELRYCNISSEGVAALATALCKNTTLHTLDLDHNPIRREGAATIAQMLPQNRTLRKLYLRDESVGEEGVRQLVSSLDQNSTLDKIGLPVEYKYISSSHPRILWSWW